MTSESNLPVSTYVSGSLAERPEPAPGAFGDRYISLQDELENSFYGSRTADSYESRLLNLIRFVTQGASVLPEAEDGFKSAVKKFLQNEIKPFRPKIAPLIDDKQNIYEIDSSKVHVVHFQEEMVRQKELRAEENYNALLPISMDLAVRLQRNGLMSWKIKFRGGKLGDWLGDDEDDGEVAER